MVTRRIERESAMRGIMGRIASTSSTNGSRQTLICSSAFSTFSGGSGGRGRGRSSSTPPAFQPTARAPGKPDAGDESDDAFLPPGRGHGRGKPIPSAPILPSFSSWMSGIPQSGRGQAVRQEPQVPQTKKPIFLRREDSLESNKKSQSDSSESSQKSQSDSSESVLKSQFKPVERKFPSSIESMISTAGRGKPAAPPGPKKDPVEENRHLRPRAPALAPGRRVGDGRLQDGRSTRTPRLSGEEAIKKAMEVLQKGDVGRGARGRGRGGRGGLRRRGETRGRDDSEEASYAGLYLGDNADGERLAQRLGPELMDKLVEGYEEMSGRILPSPMEDAYIDAFHTNLMFECEPEYLMGDLLTNPDIDEKPPILLRDALEKVKPFLMTYEGIQSQEEWEEAIEETMEQVPLMKEIIEHYCGPGRVTAKQQQQELERVAKTLPDNVPASVKQFTDRAVLSLQSNPGWGFDKKCQFMDKLVWEVSQHYK